MFVISYYQITSSNVFLEFNINPLSLFLRDLIFKPQIVLNLEYTNKNLP